MKYTLTTIFLVFLFVAGNTSAQTASYSTLYTDADISSRTIDLSRAVGCISGVAGTNHSGGVSYDIPINLPPGTNGMVPKISVSYNSLSGDGLLGMGWKLSGLSAITRAGWDTYHYGKVAAVSYESTDPYTTTPSGGGSAYAFEKNDAFLLDGTYLYPKTGAYGRNGSTYLTEAETYATTTSIGTLGGGPEQFKVVNKDGTVLEFGSSSNSRIMSDDGTKVMMWLLTKIKDVNGNYIYFTYDNAYRDFRISEIAYTGNDVTSLPAYNTITFNYVERADKNVYYDAGYSIHSRYLLSNIQIRSEGELAKTYQFNYAKDFIEHSYLKSVDEVAPDASKLNETRFKYGDNTSAVTETINSDNITPSYNTQVSSGDFDGDGLSDLLIYEYSTNPLSNKTYNLNVKVKKRSSVSGTYSEIGSLGFSGMGVRVENAYRESYMTQRKVLPNMADFNGDGRQDIIISNFNTYPAGSSYINELDYIYIYYTNPDGSISSSPSYIYIPPSTAKVINRGSQDQENYLFVGDFDGDGRSDFITMLGGKIYYHSPALGISNKDISKINLNSGSFPVSLAFDYFFKEADDVYVVNMDGDSKSELMTVTDGTTRIFTFNFNAVLYDLHMNQIGIDMGYPTTWHDINFGDFNGDGKMDILTGPVRGLTDVSTWSVGYFNGKQFVETSLTFDHIIQNQKVHFTSTDRMVIADFDGDGRTDILNIYSPNTSTPNTYNLYYSKGTGFDLEKIYNAYHTKIGGFIAPGDYNGDGKSDIFSFVEEGRSVTPLGYQVFTSFTPFSKAHLLHKVSDGFNRVTEFKYDLLTQGTGSGTTDFYTKGSGEIYPINNLQYGMYIVTGLTEPNGIGGTATSSFKYENLRTHRAGRGILGFEKVKSFNTTQDRRTETVYDLNRAFYVPYTKSTKTYIHSTNYQLTQSEPVFAFPAKSGSFTPPYTYTGILHPGGASGYKQQLVQSTVSDLLLGTTTVTRDTFDANGNVSNSGSVTTGGVDFSSNRVTTYVTTAGSSIPNQPSLIKETNRRGIQPVVATKKTFTYNSRGLVTEFMDSPDGTGAPLLYYTKSIYDYDPYGNIKLSDQDCYFPTGTDPETKYVYDAFGRFILSEENSLGHKKEYTTHKFWGKPLTEKGYNGLTGSYTYDKWGKLTSATVPTAPAASYTVTYTDTWDSGTNKLYYSTVSDPSAPDVMTWYDILNRPVKTRQESFNGDWLNTVTTYNAKGSVATSTRKYKDLESPVVMTNIYDVHNRLSSESDMYGTTNYVYTDGGGYLKTTTTLPDLKVKVVKQDASGKVVESSNGVGGTNVFEYDSRGNEISVGFKGSFAGIMVYPVRKEYDYTGQLKKLIDLDAGTTTYNYNPMGQLTWQTDPAGKTTTYTYNKLGDVIQKVVGSKYTYTYTYYGADKDYRLASEKVESTDDGIIEDTYDYAIGGGMTLHNKNTNGVQLKKTYGYDSYNRPTSTDFPFCAPGVGIGPTTGSGFATLNQYDANGFLKKITTNLGGTAKTLYELTEMNAEEQVAGFKRVDGKPALIGYTNNMANWHYTSGMQDLTTGYNLQNGNVTSRTDHFAVPTNPKEFFTYDALDRLTKSEAQITGFAGTIYHTPVDIEYDKHLVSGSISLGQITHKSDVGSSYKYGGFPQNAVKKIVVDGYPLISHETQNIQYSMLHKARRITEKIGGVDFEEQFVYDASDDRAFTRQLQGTAPSVAVARERWYMGDYEMQRKGSMTQHIHYINSDAGLCGMVVEEGGIFNYYAVYTDHLGSIVQVANESGVSVADLNFDAWGRERNPGSWSYDAPGIMPVRPDWLYRGYTSHEMLPEYGLINMNGRMYDPANGRMLRPDNYIQDPLNTQSYNRFSYCWNNPMKYTDPSGQIITWNFGNGGFSIGINFTPIGIPLGTGLNVGFSDGLSLGGYGEVGYRVGGTGFGAGATVSHSMDYNFKHKAVSNTTAAGAYASFGAANVSVGTSYNHQANRFDWSATVGVGMGNGQSGMGFAVGYGSQGVIWGMGGWTKSPVNAAAERQAQRKASNNEMGKGTFVVDPNDVKTKAYLQKMAGKASDQKIVNGLEKNGAHVTQEGGIFIVTREGVVLPRGAQIPKEFVQNPHRSSSYGIIDNGKFVEKLRIDPATPPGRKGPNYSHIHLNGSSRHFTGIWPW